jgi:hypothetical protein
MAVNLHLRDGSGAWINRVSQVKDLIKKLKKMLKDDPRAFNPKGDTRARHHQNRIILMGDFNWSSHHCGEHYWTLEALRKAFGYAVDVAMAKDFDMHDVRGAINANGVPRGWQSSKSWKKNPASTPGFPWWMATYRGTKNNGLGRSDRYDAIILVGKGWAYDDPVRSYEVAWDRGGRNPMTRSNRGGIEMSDTSNLVRNTGYRPSHSLKPGVSPKRGSPALDSDHLPIRAKVRLFLR